MCYGQGERNVSTVLRLINQYFFCAFSARFSFLSHRPSTGGKKRWQTGQGGAPTQAGTTLRRQRHFLHWEDRADNKHPNNLRYEKRGTDAAWFVDADRHNTQ